MYKNCCLTLFCLSLLVLVGADADPASQPAPPVVRDPTQAESALKHSLEGLHPSANARNRAASVPQVINRGMVIVADKPAEAIIEVTGAGMFFVHAGSVISATTSDANTVMRVISVSSDGVEIEVASQKQRLIVR